MNACPTETDAHLTRAFACATLLRAAADSANFDYGHLENESDNLASLFLGSLVLGTEVSLATGRFAAWRFQQFDEDVNRPFFAFALLLLAVFFADDLSVSEETLLGLVDWVGAVPARGGAGDPTNADLAKVARTIGKEPVYQTKAPRYCLLVFGPEAPFRVWLVQDGDVFYVDRNGNGDLTVPGNRVEKKDGPPAGRRFELGELCNGTLTHRIDSVMEFAMTAESVSDPKEFARLKGSHDQAINTWISVSAERSASDDRRLPKQIKYIVNVDGQGYLSFADRPQDAPIVHLNGPWTFGLQDVKQHLVAGQKTMLQLGVGKPGLGPGTFAFVRYPDTIPTDAHPKGDFAFHSAGSDSKTLTASLTFKKRC